MRTVCTRKCTHSCSIATAFMTVPFARGNWTSRVGVRLRAILPSRMELEHETHFDGSGSYGLSCRGVGVWSTVGVGPADTIVVEPQTRTLIKEYVVKERVAPVRVQERIAVGARFPAEVELRAVPPAWGPTFSKYRYVYSDDRVYLVEPSNRTVIQVID